MTTFGVESVTSFGIDREDFKELSSLLDYLHESFPLRAGRPTLVSSPTPYENNYVIPPGTIMYFLLGWYEADYNRININYQVSTSKTASNTLIHEYAHAMSHDFPEWVSFIITLPWALLLCLPRWVDRFWAPIHQKVEHGFLFKRNLRKIKRKYVSYHSD